MSLVLGLGLEHSCPWPRECLSSERLSLALASSIPVLGLESVCPRKGCPWPWPWPRIFFVSLALALASSLVSSTPPLITKSYEAACPMRKSLRKKDNIWWNSELASLRKEARRAWRKAIITKQEKDWDAQKLALSHFKKAVRKAKRDSWHSFVESMNSQTPTARLIKIFRRNETVRVSNVIKHNGEFTKSPLETLNYLLDILSPGSQQLENHATRSDLVDN